MSGAAQSVPLRCNIMDLHIYSQPWITSSVYFFSYVGNCTRCSPLCTAISWKGSLHLNGCGISGHFICTASLWGLTPHGISDCSCITTVALETRLCKTGAFSCEPKLHPSAKLAELWETNKIIESESKEGEVVCVCGGGTWVMGRAEMQAKYAHSLLTIMIW